MKGRLIVVDGLDGSGKQTQTALLAQRLEREGYRVKAVSFPDYAQPSSALVKEYLAGAYGQAGEVSPFAASSFYAVDRFASYNRFWKKDYMTGHTILADRYTTSNCIHQMSKLPQSEWASFARWMEDYEYGKLGLPRPDQVIYLDMYPAVSQSLLHARYDGDETKKDIHEANAAYQEQCRICAHYAVQQFGWTMITCSNEQKAFAVEEISEKIYRAVTDPM